MSVSVKIVVDRQASAQVQRKLKQLREVGGNMTRTNMHVAKQLHRWINDNFRSQGGKVGGWKPFKYGGRIVKKTAKGRDGRKLATSQSIVSGPGYRRYVDTSAKLLQDTGLLKKSFKPFWTRRSAGIGSDLPRAVAHELGLPMQNLPARRMLMTANDKDVEKNIIKIYEYEIQKIVNKQVN